MAAKRKKLKPNLLNPTDSNSSKNPTWHSGLDYNISHQLFLTLQIYEMIENNSSNNVRGKAMSL